MDFSLHADPRSTATLTIVEDSWVQVVRTPPEGRARKKGFKKLKSAFPCPTRCARR